MKILDALLEIEEKAINNYIDEPCYGICCNLSVITGDSDTSYAFVRESCKDWKCFSGDASYPVKYNHDSGLWEGKQLELRLSLIEHLITKAREQGL